MKTSKEVRQEFIEFFQARGHAFVPSSSLLPGDDPTLLFANAGMNQFKDIFLGRETRQYNRAANTQKCIRAGGKHNDLEDVGRDTYHHTFFEMLGNWSFGDYFKREAIAWAWELLTGVWGLEKDRLHVTVFGGEAGEDLPADDEARRIWLDEIGLDPSHVHDASKKDNFWEMGNVGPCGVTSEIHIDLTDDKSGGPLVNADDARVIELWNLVFMQYNRSETGRLSPLPACHVDTGLGLERVSMVLQDKRSNYATDLFVPILEKIETLTGHRHGSASLAAGNGADRFDTADMDDMGDVACRVVADHARALTFAIADGIIPSNEGRGYVLRRILRRAARYGRQYLKIDGPFLVELVPTIVELMGGFFGELRSRQEYVIETVRGEEEAFGKTLDRGIELFLRHADRIAEAGGKDLPGDVAFDLYATYGFPMDLTELMAHEAGLTVDVKGYEDAMARHRELSGAGEAFQAETVADLPPTDDAPKYSREPIEAAVLGWVLDNQFVSAGQLSAGEGAAVVLDRTNFYGEKGGQVGDTGELTFPDGRFIVEDTLAVGRCVLHRGVLDAGQLTHGVKVRAEVNAARFDTMRNHTATHLMHWALRRVLGEHVNQAGSVVAPDRLRFDFTHNRAAAAEQLAEVERLVNDRILADEPVSAEVLPLAQARKVPGVRAMFGEKYPDPVRVVTIGASPEAPGETISAEFCGGTHLSRTSQIGLFKIVSQESVAKGVRRITALTGREAVAHVQELDGIVRAAGAALRVPPSELPDRIAAMQKEIKQLRKRPAKAAGGEAMETFESLDTPRGKVIIAQVAHGDAAAMRSLCDIQRQKGAAAILLAGISDGKVTLVAMVAEELIQAGALAAGDWVRAVAPVVGGGGGGKPNLAQAGGKQPDKLPEALKAAAEYAREKLA